MGVFMQGLQALDAIDRIFWALLILGTAAVFGGFFHQIQEKSKDVTNGMFLGGIVQAVAAVIILLLADGDLLRPTWVYLIIIPALILVLVVVFRRKKNNQIVWGALGLLSAAALVLGLFW